MGKSKFGIATTPLLWISIPKRATTTTFRTSLPKAKHMPRLKQSKLIETKHCLPYGEGDIEMSAKYIQGLGSETKEEYLQRLEPHLRETTDRYDIMKAQAEAVWDAIELMNRY